MSVVGLDIHLERRSFVARLLCRMNVPADDVDDVAQDVLLKFYRSYADVTLEKKQEKVLLARIGYSTWLDIVRRRKLRSFHSGGVSDDTGVSSDEAEAVRRYVQELVDRAGLTPDDVELLEEKYGSGRTAVDIAASLGLHANTVRRRLARLMAALRRVARADDRDTPLSEVRRA